MTQGIKQHFARRALLTLHQIRTFIAAEPHKGINVSHQQQRQPMGSNPTPRKGPARLVQQSLLPIKPVTDSNNLFPSTAKCSASLRTPLSMSRSSVLKVDRTKPREQFTNTSFHKRQTPIHAGGLPTSAADLRKLRLMQRHIREGSIRSQPKCTWQAQKAASTYKYPSGWMPRKRLSPDAVEGIRAIHAQYPKQYTTQILSQNFAISPEAIRRILKSKWEPKADESERRRRRWVNRGQRIWGRLTEIGVKAPSRWR